MTTHLSVRVCWHDSGWNGCICKNPDQNVFCSSLDHIREIKDKDFEKIETTNSGIHLSNSNLSCGKINIPCRGEIGLYSPSGYEIKFEHPLKTKVVPDYDLDPYFENTQPYSFYPAPYKWMMVDNYDKMRRKESLELRDLESDDMFFPNGKKKNWIDDVILQKKILNHFWDKLENKKSFVVFYSNFTPAAEDTKRVIIGIGRIKEKTKMGLFGNSERRPGPNYVWQRCVVQNYPEEGFRIPYKEYLEQGLDTKDILITAPDDFNDQFKYVSEHVTDGAMLNLAENLTQIINQIQDDTEKERIQLSEDWDHHKKWVQKIIGELWNNRGQYPGIGSVLQFLGFNRGMSYHQGVLSPLEKSNINVFKHTIAILDKKEKPEESYKKDFKNAESKWKAYSSDKDRRDLLELLMRFETSEDHVERIMKDKLRESSGINYTVKQLLDNPYLIAESDQGLTDKNGDILSEKIPFDIIDQAMVPSFYHPDKYKNDDDRRVRALLIEELEKAAENGDTLLNINELIHLIHQRFSEGRKCEPDEFLIKQNIKFYEEKLTFIGDNNEFIALNVMRRYEKIISQTIRELIEIEYDEKQPEWESILIDRFGKIEESSLGEELEEKARTEKINALNKLYSNKFSVLTGRAGTGKTELLQLLIQGLIEKENLDNDDFLILAPTGKARVRIRKAINDAGISINLEPQTIHQHLNRYDWLDNRFNFVQEDGFITSAKTLIVDESSMMPLDLFATLIKSIDFENVKRFILVGDPNQLPPIGPGRPFDDIVNWLKSNNTYEGHLCDLKERVRHGSQDSVCLGLADAFLRDFKSKNIEEIYSIIEQKKLSESDDLYFSDWQDYDDLVSKLDDVLEKINVKDHDSYMKSVGRIGQKIDASKCESWQILTPLKHKDICGTVALNTYIQNKLISDTLSKWRSGKHKIKPFGKTKDIVYEDKVIQTVNTSRLFCKPPNNDKYVANGEIGIVKNYDRYCDKGWSQLKVSFSDQPDYLYHYFDGDGETGVEYNLDLAYAITIHKSQGSDFKKVILVIPEKAHNVSMEMMYTALTRFKEKTYLLVQGGIGTLQKYRRASNSETNNRNTYLFKISVRDDLPNIPYIENRIHRTKNGFMVRSKSEVIVANELINAGISMTEDNYEQKLPSKDDPYEYKLPDFTFKHNGETYYWEHLGMLFVDQYKRAWEKKKDWYIKNSYDKHLITSRDSDDGSINSQEIDEIIEKELGIKIQHVEGFDLSKIEESQEVEFKSSLAWDYKLNKKNKDLISVIVKTIAAFLNTSGGILVIGVTDDKKPLGIENDLNLLKKQNEDGFQLRITEIVSQNIGKEMAQLINVDFKEIDSKKIALVHVKRSDEPAYINDSDFYIRTSNSTQALNPKESMKYINKHWS